MASNRGRAGLPPVPAEPVGPGGLCCWCGQPYLWLQGAWWCSTEACRVRQAEHAVSMQAGDGYRYVYVPTAKGVEYEESPAKNRMLGGAASGAKSHIMRWGMLKRASRIRGYEGLILRRTYGELEKSQLRRLETDVPLLGGVYHSSKHLCEFPQTGALIEAGHLDDATAVSRWLSTEYDEITADEGSTFNPRFLLELSTRARTSKPEVRKNGGARFNVGTNPGGPAWPTLLDLFVTKSPDFDQFPALRKKYRPEQWHYIKALLDDNPWRDPDYEDSLAVLGPARYEQLRWGAEFITDGQFFGDWRETRDGAPWHVRALNLASLADCEWFGSMDWGYNAPGVMLWWCCLPDGHYWVGQEWKFKGRSADEVADTVKKMTRELGIRRLRYLACDPSMKAKTGHARGESIFETLQRKGLPMRASDNDRHNGWMRCHQLLREAPDGQPWVSISPDCTYGRRTMPAAVQDPKNPDDLDTTQDDHWCDGFRYGAMSRPSPTRLVESSEPPPNSWAWWRRYHERDQRKGVLA